MLGKEAKITILGSKSFLGRNLQEEFLKSNYSIRFISSRLDLNIKNDFSPLINDIENGLIILSGWPIHDDFKKSKLWCDAVFIFLKKFLNRKKSNYLICIGSAAELTPSTQFNLKENDFLKGVGDYGKAKVYLLKKFLNDKEIGQNQFCWIRLFSPTGRFESSNRLIPYVTKMALGNKNIVCNNPNVFRDYSDIEEIVQCIKYILEKRYIGIINLASGKKIMTKDLISKIISKTNSKSNLFVEELYQEEWKTASWVANIDKLKLLVPNYPKNGIDKIIEKHINLIKKNAKFKDSSF